MTALEPRRTLVEMTAQERMEDATWAITRMVELLIEEAGEAGAAIAERVVFRMIGEREKRLARRNVEHNS